MIMVENERKSGFFLSKVWWEFMIFLKLFLNRIERECILMVDVTVR